jgi:peptidylprolyl isomerase
MRPILIALLLPACAHTAAAPYKTVDEVLATAPESDWEMLDPSRLVLMETSRGPIVFALAAGMAPKTVENVLKLTRQGFYDGTGFIRAQDDYVAQWGNVDGDRPLGDAAVTVKAEFDREADGLTLSALPDDDTYAEGAGYIDGFPAAWEDGRAWLAHCYGMVGVGRDEPADSGNGVELYVVIGHAPRHLDRNVTLIGRVLEGMPAIATLPRGTEKMGFYATKEERSPIQRVRVIADMPEAERPKFRALKTGSASFAALIEARRNRRDPWTKRAAGHIDVCNVPNHWQRLP